MRTATTKLQRELILIGAGSFAVGASLAPLIIVLTILIMSGPRRVVMTKKINPPPAPTRKEPCITVMKSSKQERACPGS
jgi:hypothetical protein